ncbi:ABC-F family ATP-binding cassette domain-containing protein [Pseudactinotalea sp.]|uniref:ABC-F family ATP-binding cassette domain-containing protein n=1 Tax=Pseudactinotalea sp. TaxID=1926260 RepID=UPI003B3B8371
MAHLLGAESVSVSYPTATVLQGVTIGVDEGMRIGIVGRNGDGKSTLLRVLAQQQQPDGGRVTHRGGLRVGVLGQSDDLDDDATLAHAVLGDLADHEWAADRRSREAVAALVGDLDMDATIGTLSGGQRRRAALAALLLGDWDVLVLDEPTNHLDVDASTWLATPLRDRGSRDQGALLLVTHDRWFLDEVATTTWEVHDGIVDPFEGGYAAYVLQRVERDRQAAVAEAKRQNMMRKELAWLRRGAPARTSKPKFRIDAANQLIEDVPPLRDRVELSRMATARLGKDVVDLHEAGVAFGDNHVLRDIEWRLAPGERTGIVGGNGSGKSTLLALIAGTLAPTTGRVKHGKTVRIGTLDQQFSELEEIRDDRVRDVLARYKTTYAIDGTDLTPAQLLERLGFRTALLSARVGDLSGGQRRRLQLLLVLLDEPNVLLLDEPTNDVDTDTLAAMEDLLDTWPGTMIVISHDRYLLERVTDNQYAILDGRLRHLPGGVDEYLRLRRPSSRPTAQPTSEASSPPSAAEQAAPNGAEARAARKELAAVERRMDKLAARAGELHEQMAAHDVSDYEGLGELTEQLRAVEAETAELEERWLERSALLD